MTTEAVPLDDWKAIHRGLELGVNWIDIAVVYGFDHAEQFVGRAVEGSTRTTSTRLRTGCKR